MNDYTEEYFYWAAPIIKTAGVLLALVSTAAIINLVLQFGFYLPSSISGLLNRVNFIVIQIWLLQYTVKLILSKSKSRFIKTHWFETLLSVLIISEFAVIIKFLGIHLVKLYFLNIDIKAVTEIYIGAAQLLVVLTIIIEAVGYKARLSVIRINPSQTAIFSFGIVILVGAGLLLLPKATNPGVHLYPVDALFTSTSAICVTGLTVVDTGSCFTLFGQIIILAMIQVGGLGIMTLASFLALFFGQGMGIKDRVFLREMMNVDRMDFISSVLRNMVIITFVIEALGAVSLMICWFNEGWTIRQLIYRSIFHSVSAFCNAGFSIFPDNLIKYQNDIPIVITISSLIILGGLGFIVIMDLMGLRMQSTGIKKRYNLAVQTRLVLIITGLLLLGGFVLLYILDDTHTGRMRVITAVFNSVTSRTAGFNTIDIGVMNSPSVIVMILLMFIGASPGSTGGGIKTTTFGVLWASIHAIITGRTRIIIFKRRLPFIVLNRALVVFAFSVAVVFVAVFLLSISEKKPILDLAFEAVSAFGTVGLTRGITGGLSLVGKIIIMSLMFIGRLGTLTLAFAVTASGDQSGQRVEYPSESVMIG